ncbi:hypothetical protein A2U01_0055191, partial [Trifolium medium]|nr:hypothetical protein [Trifolium medium]
FQHVVDGLQRRMWHLKQVEEQTKKYVDLAMEAIVRESEEMLSLKEHTMMLSKTIDVLQPQVRKARELLEL